MRKLILALLLLCIVTGAAAFLVSLDVQARLTAAPPATPATASTEPTPAPGSTEPTPPTAATSTPTAASIEPTPASSSTEPAPPTAATSTPAPASPSEPDPRAFLAEVQSLPVPQRDLADLARRLKPGTTAATQPTVAATSHTVDCKEIFWVSDMASMEHFTVTATLLHVSDHLYMYVDDAISDIRKDELRSSADVFESKTYPTTRRYFGSAWAAGLDGDEHISVLHVTRLGATGAFSAADEGSVIGNPYSNGRHMIYINAKDIHPGRRSYDAVLAHEFQHAIHFFEDGNEDSWVNEGAAVLSEKLNSLGTGQSALQTFAHYPDTQLTTWGDDPDRGAHYGAAFAFLDYFHQRYGDQALTWLIEEPANGVDGFNRVLERLGKSEHFDDVFADWVVANILDDPSLSDGRYGYNDLDLRMTASTSYRSLPATDVISFSQYAGYYVELTPPHGSSTIFFTGTTKTELVSANAHSGAYQWWSNRGDMMDSTLTRSFDLTSLSSATLTYWTWYDLEQDWDYAYVTVSADDGHTWTTLPTSYTTATNPIGNNLGNGYTGKSGNGQTAVWVADKADLAPFVGKKVLVRFEYVTDDAVTNPGFCVDDIAIPELGFTDDAETGTGWQAQGFVRSSNIIPQTFVLRLITFGQRTEVQTVPVDAKGHAQVTISGVRRAILAIAGTAPITTERAAFEYGIREQ